MNSMVAKRYEQGHQTHTGAVFVTVNQAPVRANGEDALYFVRFIDNLLEKTSPGGSWNQYFVNDLPAAQDRYRQARKIFQGIDGEAGGRSGS